MVILEPLSFSLGNVSYLCVGAVPMQSDWLNSALNPVVYGDIAGSINTQYNTMHTHVSLRFVPPYDHSCRCSNPC